MGWPVMRVVCVLLIAVGVASIALGMDKIHAAIDIIMGVVGLFMFRKSVEDE